MLLQSILNQTEELDDRIIEQYYAGNVMEKRESMARKQEEFQRVFR